jgi:hypothetical protein
MFSALLVRKMPLRFSRWLVLGMGYLWAPFIGAGISVDEVSADFTRVRTSLRLRWYNRNIMGSHFGGSLFAMTDPFYMMMYGVLLGPEYVVWDYAATIDFHRKGVGRVSALFEITESEITELRRNIDAKGKFIFHKEVLVLSEDNQVVASVQKTLHARRMQAPKDTSIQAPAKK